MHSQTLARGIAAGAVLVAAALVLVSRTPSSAPPAAPADETSPLFESVADDAGDAAEQAAPPPSDAAVAAKVRELEAMSETFRHTTFLIAIRDAGFVCDELLRVSGGLDGASKWMATCSQTMAYTISVGSNGTLDVAPFLQYFDGVGSRIIEQDFVEPNTQRVLPPQTLPQR